MKKAIILIEFQNEWLSEHGSLNKFIKNELDKKRLVSNTLEIIKEAKKKKFYIVHIPLVYKNNYLEINNNADGVLKIIKEAKRFDVKSNNSNFFHDFIPKDDEIVISGRNGISGFTGSNLDSILRANQIQELFFAGFVTEVCVLSTLLSAYDKGYVCKLLTDCTIGHTHQDQVYVEQLVDRFFGGLVTNKLFKSTI